MQDSKQYLKARKFRKEGEHSLAYAEYQNAIKADDSKGYYGLALLAEDVEDYESANQLYTQNFEAIKRQAMNGDLVAATIVGVYYAMGLGSIEKSQEQAHLWFIVGALGGDEVAQFNLALHFYFGEIVEQNFELSLKWLSASAEQGYEPAIEFLKETYSNKK